MSQSSQIASPGLWRVTRIIQVRSAKSRNQGTQDGRQVGEDILPSRPTYQNEAVTSSSKMTTSLNNNLSELDTLLQDLSNSRYSERRVMDMNGGGLGVGRPSVDSLLDELNTAVPPQTKTPQDTKKE
ncbi:Transforming growth factor beta-1-induced transcript 1 protein [Homalodisca vitripennis]|nr:Transforming growth factor beta-1-induced transcript 1 protein [Homalodisca vitripennis]